MKNKTLFLYVNPQFDKRFHHGISRIYQVLCFKHGYNLKVVNIDFLKSHKIQEKYSQTLLIAGGDGTIHRVVNAVPDEMLDKYVFGIITGGTANELAKAMGLPKSIEDSAEIIASPRKIYYFHSGCVNNEIKFLTGVLHGVADYVLKITPDVAKQYLGNAAFHFGTLKLFLRLLRESSKGYRRFLINGEVHDTNYLLINNASLLSKNISKKQLSEENPNLLSLIYLRSGLTIPEMIRLMVKNEVGAKILNEQKLHYSQHKEITVEFESKLECLLDGEQYEFEDGIDIKLLAKPIAFISN